MTWGDPTTVPPKECWVGGPWWEVGSFHPIRDRRVLNLRYERGKWSADAEGPCCTSRLAPSPRDHGSCSRGLRLGVANHPGQAKPRRSERHKNRPSPVMISHGCQGEHCPPLRPACVSMAVPAMLSLNP